VVPHLPTRKRAVPEIRTQFLMTVHDDTGRTWNIGAGVDTRDRIVLIMSVWNTTARRTEAVFLPLPLATATRYLRKVRLAVVEAAKRQRD